MVPTLRIAVVVAVFVVVGQNLARDAPVSTVAAATSSASHLVADPGPRARRLGNQLVVADPPPPPPTTAPVPDLAADVIARTNAERSAAGLAPVVAHPQLMAAALAHSQDQAASQRMTHTGSDGSNAGDRIERAGYRWRTWAENVAMGYGSAGAVMDGWMGSAGHRANILNGNFVHIGVAVVSGSDGRPYWTMVLAA
jgi:uncharacterized protein YkwD